MNISRRVSEWWRFQGESMSVGLDRGIELLIMAMAPYCGTTIDELRSDVRFPLRETTAMWIREALARGLVEPHGKGESLVYLYTTAGRNLAYRLGMKLDQSSVSKQGHFTTEWRLWLRCPGVRPNQVLSKKGHGDEMAQNKS